MKRLLPQILLICCAFIPPIAMATAGDTNAFKAPPAGFSTQNSLLNNQPEFLPVEEAYQLDTVLESGVLKLIWTIAPGYYLYQDRFKVSDLTDNGTTLPLPLDFEPGERRFDDYYEKELTVYYQQTTIEAKLPSATQPQSLKVESQGCADAGLCYPPRTQYLSVDQRNGTVTTLTEAPAAPDPKSFASQPSLLLVLLFALLGGLILNLMPCVFPVLSIKALSLANAHLSSSGRHHHGIAYSAGAILTFVLIAALLLTLRAAGEALGWGFQLQAPGFVVFLIYLFFLMGLSFSGFFEVGARWMNLGASTTRGNGLRQSFMTGVLAAVVASPCTAPFMGTALGVALTQPAAIALMIFCFLGLGMALPFLMISWIPGLASKLPKAGPWMESFKEFLAFPLYLTCLWLLWVLGRQTSEDVVILVLGGLIGISLAIWCAKKTSWLARLVGIAALLVAITTTFSAIKPASHEQFWTPYSTKKLDTLLSEGRPVFVNLTADWCITCLANEKIALNTTAFKNILNKQGITYLKGDWTSRNPEITALLNKYQRSGVPLYLYFPAGALNPIVLPQLLSQDIVLNTLSVKI